MTATVAANPAAGDLVVGGGGVRKLRHRRKGEGKSGGYRTIHYFGGDDIPIFLLLLIDKRKTENLTSAQRNELAAILPRIAGKYRDRKS